MGDITKDKEEYYIYILRCEDGSLYTGITKDFKRRLNEHMTKNSRCAKYTMSHAVTSAQALWATYGRANASVLEYRIKRMTKAQKEELIAGKLQLPSDLEGYRRIQI